MKFIYPKYEEIIEDKLIETGEVYLYIAKFKDNYLQEVEWTVFAPMNISKEERHPDDGLFWNWDIDMPFSGTTQELQKHINGKNGAMITMVRTQRSIHLTILINSYINNTIKTDRFYYSLVF